VSFVIERETPVRPLVGGSRESRVNKGARAIRRARDQLASSFH